MEPIDFWGALRRSWRLFVVLALVGAVIAVLVPVSHAKRVKSALPYSASVVVGAPPSGVGSPLRAGVSSQQILFFATESDTLQATGSAAGLNAGSYALSASVLPVSQIGQSQSVKNFFSEAESLSLWTLQSTECRR